jgi:hypothetical protein
MRPAWRWRLFEKARTVGVPMRHRLRLPPLRGRLRSSVPAEARRGERSSNWVTVEYWRNTSRRVRVLR